MSSQQGYYRFPTIHNNKIVFVTEDDLWSVNLNYPKAVRLTTNLSQISHPLLSPDGKWIAYVGTEDGNTEVYVMSSEGGPSTRVTYDGNFVKSIAGWDGDNIIYSTNKDFQQFGRVGTLYSINMKGGESKNLKYGFYRIDKEKDIEVFNDAGWHFNNILSAKEISVKLKTFAHSEFADEKFSSTQRILH